MSQDLYVDQNGPLGSPAGRSFQILSLSGGGYRGLYTASLLEALEAKAGRPLNEVFDLIAGTSIGGILAIGLAAGVPASRLREAFEQHGDTIFPSYYTLSGYRILPRIGAGLLWRRYNAKGLTTTITSILAAAEGKTGLKDLKTALIVVAADATTRETRIFSARDNDQSASLLDIALATSAAPGYFPEHQIGRSVFVDGGLIANAPDSVAIMRVIGERRRTEDIHMLSLGTVTGRDGEVPRKPTGLGLIWRGKNLFQLTISAQQHLSVNLAGDLLKDRYLRLDAQPSPAQTRSVGLDRTGKKARDTLKLLATQTLVRAEQTDPARLRLMLNHSRTI